jgi:hypothetical protein
MGDRPKLDVEISLAYRSHPPPHGTIALAHDPHSSIARSWFRFITQPDFILNVVFSSRLTQNQLLWMSLKKH